MNRRRVAMWMERIGVPNVWMIGRYDYTRAQPGLPAHQHHAAMEICFLVKGQQTYRVGDRDYTLRGGDVFITFPNERHSTGGAPEEKGALYWMILRMPRASESFLGLPARLARPLVRELLNIKLRHFRGGWDLKDLLDDILATYQQRRSPLRAVRITNRVHAFLLRVVECAHAAPADRAPYQLLQYIEEHLTEPLTIPALAAQAGLSVSRFKMRFKEETGIPPVEYMQRAKVTAAKRRLAAGEKVTATAFALGFSSSQHFATVFRRYTGKSPSSFLR